MKLILNLNTFIEVLPYIRIMPYFVPYKCTLLNIAVMNDDIECAQLLIEHGAKVDLVSDVHNISYHHGLEIALARGNLVMAGLLLDNMGQCVINPFFIMSLLKHKYAKVYDDVAINSPSGVVDLHCAAKIFNFLIKYDYINLTEVFEYIIEHSSDCSNQNSLIDLINISKAGKSIDEEYINSIQNTDGTHVEDDSVTHIGGAYVENDSVTSIGDTHVGDDSVTNIGDTHVEDSSIQNIGGNYRVMQRLAANSLMPAIAMFVFNTCSNKINIIDSYKFDIVSSSICATGMQSLMSNVLYGEKINYNIVCAKILCFAATNVVVDCITDNVGIKYASNIVASFAIEYMLQADDILQTRG